jgi:hypothetical protein
MGVEECAFAAVLLREVISGWVLSLVLENLPLDLYLIRKTAMGAVLPSTKWDCRIRGKSVAFGLSNLHMIKLAIVIVLRDGVLFKREVAIISMFENAILAHSSQ